MRRKLENQNLPYLSREQVRSLDGWAVRKLGIDSIVLMENAGKNCADIILEHIKASADKKVLILAGPGNNGGDGYVIARHLLKENIQVDIIVCAEKEKIGGDAEKNLTILENMGIKPHFSNIKDESNFKIIKEKAAGCSYILDALLGTGVHGQLRDYYISFVKFLNTIKTPKIAVDIPTGLDCDKGTPLPEAVKADLTVTFAAPKKGFKNPKAKAYTGQIYVADIGFDSRLKENLS